MKTLEQCQWHRSSVFFVNCEHILNFVLIVNLEQGSIWWVYIEKANTFEDKIAYIMRYVLVIFKCKQNLSAFELMSSQTDE